jgi:hypothetical protein
MTLEEAIRHCEEVTIEQDKLCKANDDFNISQPRWRECANEHRQLAEWLSNYKRLLEQESCDDCVSRQAALDIYDDYNVAVENGELEAYRKHRKRLLKLPPVQPKQIECEDVQVGK